MAIIEKLLSEFELSNGQSVRIEVNENEKIHIHIDNFRISVRMENFEQLTNLMIDGRGEFEKLKSNDNE